MAKKTLKQKIKEVEADIAIYRIHGQIKAAKNSEKFLQKLYKIRDRVLSEASARRNGNRTIGSLVRGR